MIEALIVYPFYISLAIGCLYFVAAAVAAVAEYFGVL